MKTPRYAVHAFTPESALEMRFPENTWEARTPEEVAEMVRGCSRPVAGIRCIVIDLMPQEEP